MVDQDHNLESSIATCVEELFNDEELRLQRQVRDLESELANVRMESKLKEDTLYSLLKKEVGKSLKLSTELGVSRREHNMVETELKHTQYEKRSADSTVQQVRESENDLSKIAAADRTWLEAEMSRRSTITRETKQKSESQLNRIRRRISLQWWKLGFDEYYECIIYI